MNVLDWILGSASPTSGAIDVIAVRHTDGTIACSPFHVKLAQVAKKGEKKVVKIKVNGEYVDVMMKLGPAGEAFFVERSRVISRPGTATISSGGPTTLFNETDPSGDTNSNSFGSKLEPKGSSNALELRSSVEAPLPAVIENNHERVDDTRSCIKASIVPTEGAVSFERRRRSLSDGNITRNSSFELPVDMESILSKSHVIMNRLQGSQRYRSISDMSDFVHSIHLSEQPQKQQQQHGKERSTQSPVGPAGNSSVSEKSSHQRPISWTWNWGTLPVKSNNTNRMSSAASKHISNPCKDRITPVTNPEAEGDQSPSRERSVSLPALLSLNSDNSSLRSRKTGFGSILRTKNNTHSHSISESEYLELYAAAIEDTSVFATLSLCGKELEQILSRTDESTDVSSAESRNSRILQCFYDNLVTPQRVLKEFEENKRYITQSDDLVVLLDGRFMSLPSAEESLQRDERISIFRPPKSIATADTSVGVEERLVEDLVPPASSRAPPLRALWEGLAMDLCPYCDREDSTMEGSRPSSALWVSWLSSFPRDATSTLSDILQLYRLQSLCKLIREIRAPHPHSDSVVTPNNEPIVFTNNNSQTNDYSVDSSAFWQVMNVRYSVPCEDLWRDHQQLKSMGQKLSFTALLELKRSASSGSIPYFDALDTEGLEKVSRSGSAIEVTSSGTKIWREVVSADQSCDFGYYYDHNEHEHEDKCTETVVPENKKKNGNSDGDDDGDPSAEPCRDVSPSNGVVDTQTFQTTAPVGVTVSADTAVVAPPTQKLLTISDVITSCEPFPEDSEGITDQDNISLHDIDFDDISPEPAGGDFYDSDTDSYLSLSLEDEETGVGVGGNGGSAGAHADTMGGAKGGVAGVDNTVANGTGSTGNSSEKVQLLGLPKRRFKRYRYRKVLVPSQEQLSNFKLKHGLNQIIYELEGSEALRSSIFLWPEYARIVVADLEGVFGKSRLGVKNTAWLPFFGGNVRPHESSAVDYDCSIELFSKISAQGYKIIYIAQSSMTASPPSMQSSAEYLQSIRTRDGRFHLPVGPIFKSPDSLVRAFGHLQTAVVFRAAALRGVKSLFPANYNPFHAYFATRDSDPSPFQRFGFSEGRIFLVGDKVIHTAANRTCVLSFQRLKELIFEVFPFVKDTETDPFASAVTVGSGAVGGGRGQSTTSASATTATVSAISTTVSATTATAAMSVVCDDPTSPSMNGRNTVLNYNNSNSRSVSADNSCSNRPRISVDDSFNDYNFWRIPPAILEDEL